MASIAQPRRVGRLPHRLHGPARRGGGLRCRSRHRPHGRGGKRPRLFQGGGFRARPRRRPRGPRPRRQSSHRGHSPTIEGRPLVLEIELRLPVGAVPPREREGSPRFELGSVVGGTRRDSVYGTLHLDRAREEGGRWILPASAELFTSRGQRSIEAHLGEECLGRFLVPLPAHPGKEHETWSDWMPHPRPGDPPWPDTEPSFRHRVRITGNLTNPPRDVLSRRSLPRKHGDEPRAVA